jgi:hypothetical protein
MRRLLPVLLTTTCLALAACGGDDEETETTGGGGAATTQAAPTTPAPTETQPAAGGGAKGEPYPQEARRTFLQACDAQEGASRAACECALERIEERYSFEEFRRIDAAAARGQQPPREVTRIAENCGRETAG